MRNSHLPAIERTTAANYYGFKYHRYFVKVMEKQHPDCIVELKALGWDANVNDPYMPAWTETLLKHLGKPKYKTVTLQELGDAYGLPSCAKLKAMIKRIPELKVELEKLGWQPSSPVLLSQWLELIFLYLGEPKGIRELKQTISLNKPIISKKKIKPKRPRLGLKVQV